MRLFAAVKPDNKTLYALSLLQEQMKKQGVRGNYSPTSNLHITLAFIGEYDDPEKVLAVMRSIPFSPFEISVDGIGNFGDLYFSSMKVSEGLIKYVNALRDGFDKAGIPYDKKKFTPHITLLRRASKPVLPGITAKNAGMSADRVILMRSDRRDTGMVYTPLGYASAKAGKQQ